MSELTTQVASGAALDVPSADSSSQRGIQDFTDKLKQLWSNSQRNLVLSAVLAAIVAAIIVVALEFNTVTALYTANKRGLIQERSFLFLNLKGSITDCKNKMVKY